MTDSVAIKRQHAWGRLYNAANAVAARIGADGEISTRSPEISTLMDALAEIDGGQWCPGIMPYATALPEPTQPAQPPDIVNPISQQEPVAYRHSKTGRLYDSVEEVPLADGDEWAEPLYLAAPPQPAPAAWRQWSTKQHDWDYQTDKGDLRPDTPAEPLFVAAAQPAPAAVPLTDEQTLRGLAGGCRCDNNENAADDCRYPCRARMAQDALDDAVGVMSEAIRNIQHIHGIAAAGDKQ